MPPKKNKKIYNGFYMYMQAMMPELKRQGCQFPNGMKDAVPICHPMWKELPDAEKEVYERQAKQMKGLKNGQDASRIDSVGHRLSERIDPVAINEKRRRDERKNVSGKWPDGEGVCLETFYMIDIQSLCNKELPMEQCNGMRYLPCEIACVEFSLNAGIHKSWHKFIEPPPIPTGFRYICKSDSENTHQIPIDKFELSERSYRTICQELLDFIRGNQLGNQNYPPVYCSMGDCNKIEWCLDWLAYQAGTSNKITKVYELEGLVMDLFAHGSSGFPSKNQAHDLLTTSVFDYERNTR
uniref:Protein maelstrom homolog n=1 Tax=Saccoglossus kowalevskii TaxID=10224 RepID=A0ABM0MN40_SACKO|nr:PREDICTED: protein maelstrom homolog [Saccoglossus kowalevskii]